MNKIKSIILDQTNWLEVNIENEKGVIIRSESFGDSDEYHDLLRQRLVEFGVEATTELEDVLSEQVSKRYIPTTEEVAAQKEEEARRLLEQQIQEAKQYLTDTGWIWEKYNRNVVVLKDMTEEEFNLKYADIIAEQERNRLLINELELQLGGN